LLAVLAKPARHKSDALQQKKRLLKHNCSLALVRGARPRSAGGKTKAVLRLQTDCQTEAAARLSLVRHVLCATFCAPRSYAIFFNHFLIIFNQPMDSNTASTQAFSSTNPQDYDVLIRRWGETGYASYCPQLEVMIKGTAHVEVEDAMKQHILAHIAALPAA
jgi:hypothetical protein